MSHIFFQWIITNSFSKASVVIHTTFSTFFLPIVKILIDSEWRRTISDWKNITSHIGKFTLAFLRLISRIMVYMNLCQHVALIRYGEQNVGATNILYFGQHLLFFLKMLVNPAMCSFMFLRFFIPTNIFDETTLMIRISDDL